MTAAFVADASIAIGWVHAAQSTADTIATLDAVEAGAVLEAPALWPLEVANALTVLVRRRRLTEDQRQMALAWLRVLPVRVDHEAASLGFTRLATLATGYQLSVYDAAYLELAQRKALLLACKDGPLRSAATRLGVRLWSRHTVGEPKAQYVASRGKRRRR